MVKKNKISGIPKLNGSQSQANQESFVFWITKKTHGHYLEIGSYDAFEISNTYILESKYSWKGIGVENVPKRVEDYNLKRTNKAILGDAVLLDYEKVFNDANFPLCIDYLQVDIEPPRNNYKALKRVLRSSRSFNVITFEHDLYRTKFRLPINLIWKYKAYFLLWRKKYVLLVSNVSSGKSKFEDWYVHKLALEGRKYQKIKNIDFRQIFEP
jgi:hypothetical protein